MGLHSVWACFFYSTVHKHMRCCYTDPVSVRQHWKSEPFSPDSVPERETLAGVAESGLKGFCIGAWTKVRRALNGTQNPASKNHRPALTGHCETAMTAAVAVLRDNGGTFPSQRHKSDPQGVQQRREGAHTGA